MDPRLSSRYAFTIEWLSRHLPNAKRILVCLHKECEEINVLLRHGFDVTVILVDDSGAGVRNIVGAVNKHDHFDVILALDVFENVRSPSSLINRFKPLSSWIICSVPNEDVWRWSPNSPKHYKHFTHRELKNLLDEYKIAQWFGQDNGTNEVVEGLESRFLIVAATTGEHTKRPVHFKTMHGLGDSIYVRPIVKILARTEAIFVETPWPELYADIPNVSLVRCNSTLRTQAKNIERNVSSFSFKTVPSNPTLVEPRYDANDLMYKNIIACLVEQCGINIETIQYDLPFLGGCPIDSSRPIALIRPVTVRSEWENCARNPLPQYVAEVAETLMDTYTVVSVADIKPGQEWPLEPLPPAHIRFHSGELSARQLLSLVMHSAVIVGGVGWIVPAAIAANVPSFIILGGQGKHNGPDKLTDIHVKHRIGWAIPDVYCMCDDMKHDCNKINSNIYSQWREWRNAIGI